MSYILMNMILPKMKGTLQRTVKIFLILMKQNRIICPFRRWKHSICQYLPFAAFGVSPICDAAGWDEKSIKAINEALSYESREIILAMQKDIHIDDPGLTIIYATGTIATIKQVIRPFRWYACIIVEGVDQCGNCGFCGK